jgi:hypothetical protein
MKMIRIVLFELLIGGIFLGSTSFGPEQTIAIERPALIPSQQLTGAWKLAKTTQSGRAAPEVVKIVTGNSFTFAEYNRAEPQFVGAGGGTFTLDKNTLTETLEYFTQDSTRVGTSVKHTFQLKDKTLILTRQQQAQTIQETWQRLDEGQSPMAGAWRIRERETQPGQMTVMQRGPRKTIKWLSGTRFQWAAINPETKQFFGTGGGTYTIQNGKYTETIEFFSRDPKRVGMSVSFDHELKNSDWHHRGLSTAGNKIYEIWAKEK